MKYVFFNTGSWERNPSMMRLRELGREMIARGINVTYVVDDVPYNRAHLDLDPRAQVVHSRLGHGLRKTLAQLRPDFVHILNPAPKTCAALIGSSLRVIGDWDEWPVMRPGLGFTGHLAAVFLDRWMRHRAALNVVASKYMAGEFHRRYAVTPLYLPYATYIASTPVGPSPFNRPTAVYMGALFSAYDQDLLFDAADLLRTAGKLPPITFIGDGPDRGRWQTFIEAHQLGDHVNLKGYVNDDDRWLHLRNAHVLLFPIRSNPVNLARCPAKTFAYAQARRPVITNRVGEVPEVLGDQATYVEPTPQAFASAIEAAMARKLPDVDYGIERHNWSARADTLLAALNLQKLPT
jgi:glycosyltransferase involved in cell wall biosynthesis